MDAAFLEYDFGPKRQGHQRRFTIYIHIPAGDLLCRLKIVLAQHP